MTGNQQDKTSLKEILCLVFSASKGFWLVNAVNFGDGIAYFGMLNLMTLFLGPEGMGMGDQLTGWSVSLFTGLVTLFMFGGGFVSDKLGVRKALTLCLAFLLGGRLLMTLAAGLRKLALWPELSGPKMKLLSKGTSTPSTSFCGVSRRCENLDALSMSIVTKITVGVALTTT